MTEKLKKYKRSLREKLEHIGEKVEHIKFGEKEKEKEKFGNTMDATRPVKIHIYSESENLCYSYPIHCEGFPSNETMKGELKWYRMNDNEDLHLLLSTNAPIFHPNIEDNGSIIVCQWIPDDCESTLYQCSNFARIGPLTQDSTIMSDAQVIMDENKVAIFNIDLIDSNNCSIPKLLKMDYQEKTITIMENQKNESKEYEIVEKKTNGEEEEEEDMIVNSSQHSPSLSSQENIGVDTSHCENVIPGSPPLDCHNVNDCAINEISPNKNENENENENNHNATDNHQTIESISKHNDLDIPLNETETENKNENDKIVVIKIKEDCHIEMFHNNTQELILIQYSSQSTFSASPFVPSLVSSSSSSSSSSTSSFLSSHPSVSSSPKEAHVNQIATVLLHALLRTTHERDLLYFLLNCIITKKQPPYITEIIKESNSIKNVVKLEICPILSGEKTPRHSYSSSFPMITLSETPNNQEKNKNLEKAYAQIFQLKMENTRLLEEKKFWKTEKDQFQEVSETKSDQINKLLKEKKEKENKILQLQQELNEMEKDKKSITKYHTNFK